MSQEAPDILTKRYPPLLLMSGSQGGDGVGLVHDNGHSPVTPMVGCDVVAKSDKPTVGQNNLMKPKQSRLTTFFARKPSPRDTMIVRVSDTSSTGKPIRLSFTNEEEAALMLGPKFCMLTLRWRSLKQIWRRVL